MDRVWYIGTIYSYNPHKKQHRIVYDDKMQEWCKLPDELFVLDAVGF